MSEPPKAQLPLSDPRPSDVPWPPLRWPVPADAVLLGRAVELRPTAPDRDAAELFAALDSDEVWRHVRGRPSTVAEQAAALHARIDAGQQPFTVRLRQPYRGLAAGAVAGTSSYLDVSTSDGRLEIGFTAYTRPLWGSVVNPDAKLALLRYAFDELGAGRVQLKTDIRNSRSQLRDRPPRCRLRRAAAPVSTARGRHDPRHRGLLDHRRRVVRRPGRAAGPRR